MKKVILGLLLAITISTASFAVTPAAPMTAYKGAKGPEFETLSKADKIKLIEQKHAESKVKADAKWKSMSDDEKIAKYEHRRQAFMARRNGMAAPAAGAPVAATPAAATTPVTPLGTTPVKK